jgi:glycine cleavage system H lipoate-binding protein
MTNFLIIVGVLVVFLAIDWLVGRYRKRHPGAGEEVPPESEWTVRLPDGIYFAPSHTWLSPFPSGIASLGVDDFIARMLSHPRIELLRRQGERILRGDPILRLTSDGHALTVRAPVDAEVLLANDEFTKHPAAIGHGLFELGWIYLLRPARSADVKAMRTGPETRSWMRREFARLKRLLATPGVMREEDWARIDREFLSVAPPIQGGIQP